MQNSVSINVADSIMYQQYPYITTENPIPSTKRTDTKMGAENERMEYHVLSTAQASGSVLGFHNGTNMYWEFSSCFFLLRSDLPIKPRQGLSSANQEKPGSDSSNASLVFVAASGGYRSMRKFVSSATVHITCFFLQGSLDSL